MAQGISSHGTIIEYESTPGGGFDKTVEELGDFDLPGLMRNEHDITSHNRDIDTYELGVLRRNGITFPIFFNKANPGQVGLYTLIQANTLTGFRITQPDGFNWILSGKVQGTQPSAPVDGVQTARVTIRPSGPMILDGVAIG